MKQRTIKKSVEIIGIGLHKGVPIKLRIEPADVDNGIVFYRSDEAVSIPLKIENVTNTEMATVIGKNEVEISTIEHLLSAVAGFGIDNLRIVLDNNEIPIMDGSSVSFTLLFKEAGIQIQNKSKKILKIKKELKVTDKKGFWVKIEPSDKTEFNFTIDFNHPMIGEQTFNFEFSTENYIDNISKARTFGFLKDIQYLRNKGLALGGSLDNAIVLDDKKILNENLRFNDEFVRHKILDAIGDMRVIGYNFIGKYKAFGGGHHLNHLLTEKIFSNSNNYELVELNETNSGELSFATSRS